MCFLFKSVELLVWARTCYLTAYMRISEEYKECDREFILPSPLVIAGIKWYLWENAYFSNTVSSSNSVTDHCEWSFFLTAPHSTADHCRSWRHGTAIGNWYFWLFGSSVRSTEPHIFKTGCNVQGLIWWDCTMQRPSEERSRGDYGTLVENTVKEVREY